MKLLQYVSELLLHKDCVIIPEFGGFIANYIPAQVHPVIHSFSPPKKEILFNSSLKHNDGLLVTYIAQKEKISYEQAMSLIKEFTDEANRQLNTEGKLIVQNIGTIFFENNQYYKFIPDNEANFLLSSYGLSSFVSPAIQRVDIEKRIANTFAERKITQQTSKKKTVLSKIAIISIPAAAIFVWAFINIKTIKDVSENFSGIGNIFTTNNTVESSKSENTKSVTYNNPAIWKNPFHLNDKYNPLEKNSQKIIYPFITDKTTIVITEEQENITAKEATSGLCKYYIIGSCNRNREFAEHYIKKLHAKGFSNAGIIEPLDGGLYKVFIDCFETESQAIQQLDIIHNSENPDAWILKM